MSKITGNILNISTPESSFSSEVWSIYRFDVNSEYLSILQRGNYTEYNFDISQLIKKRDLFCTSFINYIVCINYLRDDWSVQVALMVRLEDKYSSERLISFLEKNGIHLRGIN